jgi:hypothetical protein
VKEVIVWAEVEEADKAVVDKAAVEAVGRAGWAAPRLPGRAAIASAPIVDIGRRIRWVNPVINKNALSAARRWCASE